MWVPPPVVPPVVPGVLPPVVLVPPALFEELLQPAATTNMAATAANSFTLFWTTAYPPLCVATTLGLHGAAY